ELRDIRARFTGDPSIRLVGEIAPVVLECLLRVAFLVVGPSDVEEHARPWRELVRRLVARDRLVVAAGPEGLRARLLEAARPREVARGLGVRAGGDAEDAEEDRRK